jgi:hypothetical protein
VEAAERRKDARLAKELVVALPHELDEVQRLALVQAFADHYTAQGLVADFAIHAPASEGDQRNFHLHMMLTTRALVGGQLAKGKAQGINKKGFVHQARGVWEDLANKALAEAGSTERVSKAKLSAQGLIRAPQKPHKRLERVKAFPERERSMDDRARDQIEAFMKENSTEAVLKRVYQDPETAREEFIRKAEREGVGNAAQRVDRDPETIGVMRKDLDPAEYLQYRAARPEEVADWIKRNDLGREFDNFLSPDQARREFESLAKVKGIREAADTLEREPQRFGTRGRTWQRREEPEKSTREATNSAQEARDGRAAAKRGAPDTQARAAAREPQADIIVTKTTTRDPNPRVTTPSKVVYQIDISGLMEKIQDVHDRKKWFEDMQRTHRQAVNRMTHIFRDQYGSNQTRAEAKFIAYANRKGIYVAMDRLREDPEAFGTRQPTAKDWKKYQRKEERQRERQELRDQREDSRIEQQRIRDQAQRDIKEERERQKLREMGYQIRDDRDNEERKRDERTR